MITNSMVTSQKHGESGRVTWSFEIVDDSEVPVPFRGNPERIWKTVKAMMNETNIPGVRVFSVEG